MSTLLWWGRSDPNYSRNRTLLTLLERLGWDIRFFHPVSSMFGKTQAFFQKPEIPDLIWVPCFRQRDMHSALYWARRWKCPLVFDPLISAYQKEVFEKRKWAQGDRRAERLRRWEAQWFLAADLVIADTQLHAQFYVDTFGIDSSKVVVVHVGADDQLFKSCPLSMPQSPLEILFYGSFLPLHGPEVIVDAAALLEDQHLQWVMLGDGDSKAGLQHKAQGMRNVRFEPWIAYQQLPKRIARAHILLGIFGTTPKASMVIPNKAFQAMAVGRPLVTIASEAYPPSVSASQVIGWVPPGDPKALAERIGQWVEDPVTLVDRGRQTRLIYDEFFTMDKLQIELQGALDMVKANGGH